MRILATLLCGLVFAGCFARGADPLPAPSPLEERNLRQLATIRRVYVDRLTGGETAAQMRDILISALAGTELFVVTENQEHADMILRGASEDLIFTDTHTSSDSVNAHMNAGTGRTSSRSTGPYGGVGVGDSESDHSAERRHEAVAAVRLVNKDGDVIWSTTQESFGAKFRGASADVAEKIVGKLKEDFERARRLR
ncbi:MAG TPA: hypothetical protein VKU19_28985 [Bryobacteraceae bacterium]|nr:hypothetical protein [Bryobacteraceae bacterium]